jgi:uncharacterized membrane protein
MSTPDWGLSIVYWLHMLATVVWLGTLSALALVVLPVARRALDASAFATLLNSLQKRIDPLGWFCLAVLAGTGMFQMSSSPNYEGFLVIDSAWGMAILLKHLAFGVMIAASAYMTWFLLPELRRNVLKQAQGQAADPALERRSIRLLNINLLLAVLILALTAIARVS